MYEETIRVIHNYLAILYLLSGKFNANEIYGQLNK